MKLPEPRQATQLYHHHEAELAFARDWQRGSLHHAWLMAGPHGIGKMTLAFRLARIVLGGEDASTAAGKRISAGTHGDLLEISRQYDPKKGRWRGEITVADIRSIQQLFHHTATEGGWRVVLIDGAEFLNRSAANALLKFLEEPPPQTVLLLTTTSPGMLLPTIRSRCRVMPLSPLTDAEMRQLLPHLPEDLLQRARGAPGRALFLAHDSEGHIAELARHVLEGQGLNHTRWKSINRLARDPDGFALLCDALYDGVARQAREEALKGHLSEAAACAQKCSELETLRRQTESFNLDKAQAMRQAVTLASS